MISIAKKVWITIWAILGALAIAAGLIMDAPQAIQKIDWPMWAANPDVWWVLVISIVTGTVIFFIWFPSLGKKGNGTTLFLKVHGIKDDNLIDIMAYSARNIKKHREKNDKENEMVYQLENILPTFIQATFGKAECDKYTIVMEQALENSESKIDAYLIVHSWLKGRITVRRNKLYKKLMAHVLGDLATSTQ